MTNEAIETFLAVVRYGSLSGAAQHLHISQPALGKRLGQLEEELGCTLIERQQGIRRINLTPEGNAFLPQAERYIDIKNRMLRLAEEPLPATKLSLNIGSSDGPHLFVMNDANIRFKEKHPDVFLRLHTYAYRECYRRVASGKLDAAIVGANYYYQDVVSRPLYSEKMVFICRSDSAYPEKVDARSLNLADCIYSPYSSDFINWFSHWFRLVGNPYMECDLVHQVLSLLFSTGKEAWSIVPATVAKAFMDDDSYGTRVRIERRKLKSPPPDRTMYLITGVDRDSEQLDNYIKELSAFIGKNKSVRRLL